MIIKILGNVEAMSIRELVRQIGNEPKRVQGIINQLIGEGLVQRLRTQLSLP